MLFAKLSAYAVSRLRLSQWFGFIETVDIVFKKFDGLMKKFDSQPRQFMLFAVNSFKLMIEIFVKQSNIYIMLYSGECSIMK